MQSKVKPSGDILIVGPSWVGDMVMSQPLYATLKKNNPDAKIDVLAPAYTTSILSRMPEVNQSIVMPIEHGKIALFERYRLAKTLKQKAYGQAIVLPNSFKSALIPFWANIPKRTGWLGECRWGVLNDHKKLDKQCYPLMVERFVALADLSQPIATYLPPRLIVDKTNITWLAQQYGIQSDKPMLSLCPGAEYGPAKRWPEKYFAQLAQYYLHKGWQVCLFGSDKDALIGQSICQEVSEVKNLIGKTNLAEAIDLISLSTVVISNDSGLMHVAAALDCPLIAIFGSSDPRFTPPMGNKVKIVSLNLSCSPCFKRTCPLEHMNCLNQLSAEQVIGQTEALLVASS